MANDEFRSATPFGQLLRQLRTRAGLTQEDLAQAAGLSTRTVSDLERGINLTARKASAKLLADALELDGVEREDFLAAARDRPTVAATSRTLPRDVDEFVGRDKELTRIASAGIRGPGVFAIGGLPGVGKSAFAAHAAHLLAAKFPDGQLYLSLHAHTPGQQPADPADALASLLQTAGVAVQQIPHGADARAAMWRGHLAGKRVLILLDDALDSEQVRPLLPGSAGCLVLVTSRRRLTGLDHAIAINLEALTPGEAADLLVGLADRDDLDRADLAVGQIAALCGNLPLAIGMMARRLHHHLAWTAADLATELAGARERLKLMQSENLSVAAAFDLSYDDLTEAQRRMFRRLGLHPGADFDGYAAAALDDIGLDAARQALEDLYDHYLVSESARGRYHFHDLIREYAHRAGAEEDRPADRIAAADRVLDYYLHVARAADDRLGHPIPEVAVIPPAHVPEFAGSKDAIMWMEAERLNLLATAEDAAERERRGHAAAIPAAMHEFLRRQGHWRQALRLDHLAVRAALHGEGQIDEARARYDLGDVQLLIGDYRAAEVNLRKTLDLCVSLGNRIGEANARAKLGEVLNAAGDPAAAAQSLAEALKTYRAIGSPLGEANALTALAEAQEALADLGSAENGLEQALILYRQLGERHGEATALAQLGSVRRRRGQEKVAAADIAAARALFHDIGDRPGEARALNNLGELALAAGNPAQARESYDQALRIARSMNAPKEEARALDGITSCTRAAGEAG